MKRTILAMFMALALLLCAGCGASDGQETADAADTAEATDTTDTTETTEPTDAADDTADAADSADTTDTADDAGSADAADTGDADTTDDTSAADAADTPVAIPLGESAQYDLDGDGTADEVYYAVSEDTQDADGAWTGAIPTSLTVNGAEFLTTDQENAFSNYDIWPENPDTDYYYLVDLDSSDGYLELAICDYGSNDYRTTYLFRYDQGSLTYLGAISGLPADEETVYHGDGTVSAADRLQIFQTWSAVVTYALEDGQMSQLIEMVEPIANDGDVCLTQTIEAYTEADQSSDTVTLTASEEPVTFPQTDTQSWVEVVLADGTTGWLYLENYTTIVTGDQSWEASEVFSGLVYAG